ncbi:MAG: hypothetical protein F6J93_30505 [Oscillatoria sp. SIO1A7]|nr:hypothetical protein [Oscillatoria sp. SIO1A7]
MPEKLRQILAELEREKHRRRFDIYRTEAGEFFVVFWSNVEITDDVKIYPCDTVVYVKTADRNQPLFLEWATFATFICHGALENSRAFSNQIDVLNYHYLGKFVRDYTDGSQDILYVTSERLSSLTLEALKAHLEHHAKAKATVIPHLERLRNC